MEEKDDVELKIEKRMAEVEEARRQESAILENMTEEEMVEYLVNQYRECKKFTEELGLETISEDDING